ncbi:EamA family transporter [Acidovorax sp. NCPPB 3859]|nr:MULTISPECIES: EamA family transporter [unclassified Acidovorax]MDA8449714.1 EamA family transporter [Acidovorax sp. GBBC 3297]MDA8459159.1 EamA family transporter [Acidovorax sp. GBBC 3333]MDA8464057.1 EamA family transporter [Acidovorax sp. GBBC 3332]MDA8469228.1 EamA family transporter [Acidovorax sp. GBBC 3299]WCM81036.1 EamA family transporter [Acidovorax sp. GBBC 712]
MSTSHDSPLIPALAILGSVTFLGIGTSWAKHSLFPLVGAQGTTALRVGFSALLLLLLWRPWRRPLARADAVRIAAYGAALGAMNLCFYLSLQTTPFGVAVAIEFSGPLSVALLSSRRPLDFLWVVLAVAGLGLLLPWEPSAGTLDLRGVLFALAAAVFWAGYILFGKRLGHLHTGHSVSLGLAAASLVVVPVGIGHAGAGLLAPGVLLTGIGVAALSSAVPIMLEMVALKRLPQQAFGIMISMEPAVAALLALVLLGEYLSPAQWLAIGMIVAASMGCAFSAPRRSPRPQPVLPADAGAAPRG